jgi:hypothetical protein
MNRPGWTRTWIPIVAIVAVAVLEGVALATGHDGQLFLTVIALIGSIAGVGSVAESYLKDLTDAHGSDEGG